MRYRHGTALALACLLPLTAAAVLAAPASGSGVLSQAVDIPFQKFVLDNGLTLIVHEDPKAPIVAVNVWYHVGSKNERPGKTGFAHLFEHLMFNGSENFNDDYFKAVEPIGATDLNGTTNEDRTNYFENVPKSALDRVLWLESDRMGHLLKAVDQGKLDEQRGVVQNEKRQGENQPYAVSRELITKACYPAGHPYSWTVIGSMDDLNAASLEDVQKWFTAYYGPANAVLAVAGDVKADDVLARVKRYFGDIPSGPPVARFDAWVARRTGEQRQEAQDRVPQARIYKVWNVPQTLTADADLLGIAARVLSSGKTSRLYKRLVYDDQIATSVRASVFEREIGSLFTIEATAKPGGELAPVEKAIDEELARLMSQGPTEDEMLRAKTDAVSRVVRGLERIGGFGGKSDRLASSEVLGGSPDAWKASLDRIRVATAGQVKDAAARWLADGVYVLQVLPFPKYQTAAAGADRAKMPDPGAPPAAKFPPLQKAELANGLKVVLAERHAVPVVEMELIVDSGFAADQLALPGTTNLAMSMLDEGTEKRTSLQISDELQRLGAELNTGADVDTARVQMSALKANLDASLDLYADVILHPAFPAADFDRLKKQQVAGIQREKVQPNSMAQRVFPKLLYGEGHAYGMPFSGSGYEESVAKITRDDLVKFHRTWFMPNVSTLVVVGDTSLAEIRPKLEALFQRWERGTAPKKNLKTVAGPSAPTIYLVDKPGAIQSVLLAASLAPPKKDPDEIALETMNEVLGGAFISRLNMNLREDKHWSYGASGSIQDAAAQRAAVYSSGVQTDKTKESLAEMAKEFDGISGARPVTAAELSSAQNTQTLTLPGRWETNTAVRNSISELVQFSLPDNYFETFADKVRGLKTADVDAAGKKQVHRDKMVWVVVGDRAVIEPGLRELGWGDVRVVDADGNAVK
jgi:zinc protease